MPSSYLSEEHSKTCSSDLLISLGSHCMYWLKWLNSFWGKMIHCAWINTLIICVCVCGGGVWRSSWLTNGWYGTMTFSHQDEVQHVFVNHCWYPSFHLTNDPKPGLLYTCPSGYYAFCSPSLVAPTAYTSCRTDYKKAWAKAQLSHIVFWSLQLALSRCFQKLCSVMQNPSVRLTILTARNWWTRNSPGMWVRNSTVTNCQSVSPGNFSLNSGGKVIVDDLSKKFWYTMYVNKKFKTVSNWSQ